MNLNLLEALEQLEEEKILKKTKLSVFLKKHSRALIEKTLAPKMRLKLG